MARVGVVGATGLVGGRTGTRIVEDLTTEAILNDFVRIGDESRTSTMVVAERLYVSATAICCVVKLSGEPCTSSARWSSL